MKMEGQRPRGRPKLRWKDSVRRDLKSWNIKEEWATDSDREPWTNICKTRYTAQGDGGERLELVTLSPLSMERVLERFRRRLCLRVFRAEHALLLKKNASTINIAHVSMGADCPNICSWPWKQVLHNKKHHNMNPWQYYANYVICAR